MMKLVQRLADKGYAAIERDPSDRRALRIRPTERRERWALQYAAENEAALVELFSDFQPAELAAFADAQKKLHRRLGLMEEGLRGHRS
jgi:DNA-binding MarR family transcriptional regulator